MRNSLLLSSLLGALALSTGCSQSAEPSSMATDRGTAPGVSTPAADGVLAATDQRFEPDSVGDLSRDTAPSAPTVASRSQNTAPSGLRVYLTDAPVEFDEVWVEISSVEIGVDGADAAPWSSVMEEPQTLDLLTLQDGVTTILGDAELAAGSYGQLRLIVDSAWVVSDGATQALFIPSGAQTGLKLDLGLNVEPGTDYALVLDFDAQASIKQAGKKLMMTPVIKVKSLSAIARGTAADAGSETAVAPDAGDAG